MFAIAFRPHISFRVGLVLAPLAALSLLPDQANAQGIVLPPGGTITSGPIGGNPGPGWHPLPLGTPYGSPQPGPTPGPRGPGPVMGRGPYGRGPSPGGGSGPVTSGDANTRSRFALNTSISGSGVLNASLDSVTQFGIGLNGHNQGNMYGNNGAQGMNQQTNNALGTLSKQPPGVVVNAMYNGSTTYGIFGNQQVQGYSGATPQYGFPGYGGYSPYGYSPYGYGYPGNARRWP
jgi:hypothetical protein